MPKVGLHKKFNYFLLGQFEEREKLTWKEPLDEENAGLRIKFSQFCWVNLKRRKIYMERAP